MPESSSRPTHSGRLHRPRRHQVGRLTIDVGAKGHDCHHLTIVCGVADGHAGSLYVQKKTVKKFRPSVAQRGEFQQSLGGEAGTPVPGGFHARRTTSSMQACRSHRSISAVENTASEE